MSHNTHQKKVGLRIHPLPEVCDFNHKWAKDRSIWASGNTQKYMGLFTERVWEKAHHGETKVESVCPVGAKDSYQKAICCNHLHPYRLAEILPHD
jgi:hypothetical protein